MVWKWRLCSSAAWPMNSWLPTFLPSFYFLCLMPPPSSSHFILKLLWQSTYQSYWLQQHCLLGWQITNIRYNLTLAYYVYPVWWASSLLLPMFGWWTSGSSLCSFIHSYRKHKIFSRNSWFLKSLLLVRLREDLVKIDHYKVFKVLLRKTWLRGVIQLLLRPNKIRFHVL